MGKLEKDDVGIIGRKKNAVLLGYQRDIILTTDYTDDNLNNHPSLSLDHNNNRIESIAHDILLESSASSLPDHHYESLVYGEKLVVLLRWIIRTLKSHSHPPNGPPVPNFFETADEYLRDMENIILNKRVKSR